MAKNAGGGISGGTVRSSAILYQQGYGLATPSLVENSWIVGNKLAGLRQPIQVRHTFIQANGGAGVEGRPAAPLHHDHQLDDPQ